VAAYRYPATLVDALYKISKRVARLTDGEFVAVEKGLRECIDVLQVRALPPIAGSDRYLPTSESSDKRKPTGG
jgi:hypothetical protein